jgi:hypothetical protein
MEKRAREGVIAVLFRMFFSFALLALAMLALWIPVRGLWAVLGVAALGAALAAGIVQPIGLGGIALWFGALVGWKQVDRSDARPGWRGLMAIVLLAMATALMLHRVPGFVNPRVIDAVRFTADAVPFTLYLNFDKTLVGLGLLALGLPRIATTREWARVL